MATLKYPGVYVNETPSLPSSISGVPTCVPVFIGYTEKTTYGGRRLTRRLMKINSLAEFEQQYGLAKPKHIRADIDDTGRLVGEVAVNEIYYKMHYALQLYFINGGGPCFILSLGGYPPSPIESHVYGDYVTALQILSASVVPTIVVMPDAPLAGKDMCYQLYQVALFEAASFPDRFILIDLVAKTGTETFSSLASDFRTSIGNSYLENGAAYYPYLQTYFTPYIDEQREKVKVGRISFTLRQPDNAEPAALRVSLFHANRPLYESIKHSLANQRLVLPPSAAVAGAICRTDKDYGVWKAPANVSLAGISGPVLNISNKQQEEMMQDPVGHKTINPIRSFPGKGTLIWGARTLAGSDNDYKYIPVRRFVGFVEASINEGTKAFVFEPNDANTWAKVKNIVGNFLNVQWRTGALQGTKPEQAYYVAAGLGRTMTEADIAAGKLIIEIGMAVVRPAEFIIRRFVLNMADRP